VLVAFHENRVVPKRMRWNSREYEIRSVNLVHTAREGAKRVFYFSVSDLTNYFKLKLDPEFLEWQLVETYTDG
jgi:ribosomal protein L24E